MAPKKEIKKDERSETAKAEAPAERSAPKAAASGTKIKPQLDKITKEQLALRAEKYAKQPAFIRNEWFRYKRLERVWRRPRGQTNKLRENYRYRPAKVRVGYGKPKTVRGLHPSGFQEVMVFRVEDLGEIDPKVQAARIGSTVGTRKRREIVESADKMGIRVLNRGVF